MEPLSHTFYRGDFNGFLKQTINHNPPLVRHEDIPLIVGSFVFTGQLHHAQNLLEIYRDTIAVEFVVQAQFFIGVGLNRSGKYQESKQVFTDNLYLYRQHRIKDHLTMFFLKQGLGFHYLYCSRYRRALKAAREAANAAFKVNFLFGRILAADLLGNIYPKVGQFILAGKSYKEAKDLAETLGNSQIAAAVAINSNIVRSQSGHLSEEKDQLKQLFEATKEVNNFSAASLGLELCRDHVARGQLQMASAILKQVGPLVKNSGNGRQLFLYHFRGAYISFLKGDWTSFEEEMELAQLYLNQENEHSFALAYFGLKRKFLQHRGSDLDSVDQQQLKVHQLKSGYTINLRIDARSRKIEFPSLPGDDIIGDTLDHLAYGGITPKVIHFILNHGYLGLLREVLNVQPGGRKIVFDIMPGRHLFFDEGQVTLLEGTLAANNRALVNMLAQRPHTIEEIVKNLWGLNYVPHKHNSPFYSAISRLRKFLGPFKTWLIGEANSYFLKEGTQILLLQNHSPTTAPNTLSSLPGASLQSLPQAPNPLNLRQINMAIFCREQPYVNNQVIQEQFNVSYATATRDLRTLTAHGILQKVGKGRATSYRLCPDDSH